MICHLCLIYINVLFKKKNGKNRIRLSRNSYLFLFWFCVSAIAPAMQECPTLRGPELVEHGSNSYVYFYCEFTQDTNASETYTVRFLFNNEADYRTEQILEFDEEMVMNNISVPLHEKYLYGHMGKWVSGFVIKYACTCFCLLNLVLKSK